MSKPFKSDFTLIWSFGGTSFELQIKSSDVSEFLYFKQKLKLKTSFKAHFKLNNDKNTCISHSKSIKLGKIESSTTLQLLKY